MISDLAELLQCKREQQMKFNSIIMTLASENNGTTEECQLGFNWFCAKRTKRKARVVVDVEYKSDLS